MVATGVPPGLGSHVQWDRKLDGRLAQALMSIQAIKGVEIGAGFGAARTPGSQVHDPIDYDADAPPLHAPDEPRRRPRGRHHQRRARRLPRGDEAHRDAEEGARQRRRRTKEAYEAAFERSDVCAVAAACVVGEAMVCIVLADALLEKFGGDSLRELARNVEGYRPQLAEY